MERDVAGNGVAERLAFPRLQGEQSDGVRAGGDARHGGGAQLTHTHTHRGSTQIPPPPLSSLSQGVAAMTAHLIPLPCPHRFSRLQHILGGKSRRITATVNAECPLQAQPENHDDPDTVDGSMPRNLTDDSTVDLLDNEDLGLEIAMKQLVEATHDALVNMKGEILRMECELERASMQINVLQQREESLQNQIENRTMELEKKFCKQIHELQETMIVELKICKQQMEQNMIQKLEVLLEEMKTVQNNGSETRRLANQQSYLKRSQYVNVRKELDSSDAVGWECMSESAMEVRSTLTEAMLQRISPKRLEQSAAVVRGWLQSSTPSESSSIAPSENVKAFNLKRRLNNLPMGNLVSSVKAEAKLYATHRRACLFSRSKSCDPSTDTKHIDLITAPNTLPLRNISDVTVDSLKEMAPNSCSEKICQSPVSVLDATVDAHEEITEFLSRPSVFDKDSIPLWSEAATQESQTDGKKLSLASPALEKPILRILKPESFKISDLLLSDSEEDMS